jgi:hypothetical protein
MTSTRITHSPAVTATVTIPPGAPERLWRTLLPKSSLTKSAVSVPHGCPEPSTPATNARATRARSASPANVTLSRTLTISARVLPWPPAGEAHRSRAHGHGNVRSTQPLTSSRKRPPARPVRGRPWKSRRCRPTVLVAHTRPPCVRGPRSMAVYSATRRHTQGRRQNGPPARIRAANGPFLLVVAGVGFEPT